MIRSTLLILVILSTAFFGCKDRLSDGALKQSGSWVEGAEPPNFELSGIDSKQYTLASFAGKTVLVNFWATWCPPCTSEMGAFERLYKLLRAEGLEVLSINVDSRESLPEVKSFLANNGISFPVLLDPDMKTASSWNLSGFPETFFIGKDGKLLAIYDLEDKINSTRIVANRPWDAPEYIAEIRRILQKQNK